MLASPSRQKRLLGYGGKIAAAGTTKGIVNAEQAPDYMRQNFTDQLIIPSLLTRSHLHFIDQANKCNSRCVLPLEHFAIHGVPVFKSTTLALSAKNYFKDDELEQLSDTLIRRAAGNGMHVNAVGSVLLFKLATVVRIGEDDDADTFLG